jgi:uncharacterized protein (TIGR00369 family)
MSKERVEKLLEMYNQRSRLGRFLGIQISFDEQERAVITLPYNPTLTHAMGSIHGGIIAILLDNAGWFTCAAAHEQDGWVATSEMSVHLLKPATKTDLKVVGQLLKKGKRQAVAEMKCYDDQDQLVAHGTGTFIYLDHLSVPAAE